MRRSTQRGILLLPVALTLALVGTVAYALTREGSMQVSAVDAEYDMEAARYLTESGLHLAKWQNQKAGCPFSSLNTVKFGTVTLGDDTLVSDAITKPSKGVIAVSLTATTRRGTVRTLTAQQTTVYDYYDVEEVTINGGGGNDTTITNGVSTSQGAFDYLELTDGKSHALLKFSMPSELDNASVISAQLKLTQYLSNSTQPERFVTAHRVLRDWNSGATWTSPWTTDGGDYAPAPTARVDIDAEQKEYVLFIDGLVQSWAARTMDNRGLLLKPSGLLNAKFRSLDASTSSYRPKLVVRYHPRCNL